MKKLKQLGLPGLEAPALQEKVRRMNELMQDRDEHCRDCRWWELLWAEPAVSGHGACHHPVSEAQHIAHTGAAAPGGLSMEGARKACTLFEPGG